MLTLEAHLRSLYFNFRKLTSRLTYMVVSRPWFCAKWVEKCGFSYDAVSVIPGVNDKREKEKELEKVKGGMEETDLISDMISYHFCMFY